AEGRAHRGARAAGPGPAPRVGDALAAAAAAARARAANAAAGQFAAKAVLFTPGVDDESMVRRRIRAGFLLWLAGDVEGSLEHVEALDIDQLATADLERALPLLTDLTDVVHGAAAAEAIRSAEKAGDAAADSLHRARINLAVAKANAAEGLDTALLDRAAGLEPRLSVLWAHDTADTYRALWSRYNEDLDTARSALRRCIAHAEDAGD